MNAASPDHRLGLLLPATRERIFREVFAQYWQHIQRMPERTRHNLSACLALGGGIMASPTGTDHRPAPMWHPISIRFALRISFALQWLKLGNSGR